MKRKKKQNIRNPVTVKIQSNTMQKTKKDLGEVSHLRFYIT